MDDRDLKRATEIDRYLKGDMDQEEKYFFEQKVTHDAELKNELEKTQISSSAVKYQGLQHEISDIRGRMKDKETGLSPESQQKQTIERPLPLGFYAFRVAASLLLVLLAFAGIQMAVIDPEGIYQEKINYEVVDVVERSDEESSSLSNILKSYQQENYQDATATYKIVEAPTIKEKYIAAAAYLKLQEYNEAVEIYNQIIEGNIQATEMDYWEQRAAYNLAITNVQLGNYDEAVMILDQLKSNEEYGDYYDQLLSDYSLWKLRLLSFKKSILD